MGVQEADFKIHATALVQWGTCITRAKEEEEEEEAVAYADMTIFWPTFLFLCGQLSRWSVVVKRVLCIRSLRSKYQSLT